MSFGCQVPVGSLQLWPFPLWPAAVDWNVEIRRAAEEVALAPLSARISSCPGTASSPSWTRTTGGLSRMQEAGRLHSVCDPRPISLVGFHRAGHLLYALASSKDSLCVVSACRLAAPQGRVSPLPPVVDLGSAPQMLASWRVCLWSMELFLLPLGLELLLPGFLQRPLLGW